MEMESRPKNTLFWMTAAAADTTTEDCPNEHIYFVNLMKTPRRGKDFTYSISKADYFAHNGPYDRTTIQALSSTSVAFLGIGLSACATDS